MTTQPSTPNGQFDPAFPVLHGRPSQGWVNDPNGLARIDGRWHVFFQYNPDGPHHERIHWGHASSPDLVTWRHEPIALTPRPDGLDAHGCWTGCVVDDDGVPTAVYTAIRDDPRRSVVAIARSDRTLRDWVVQDEPVARQDHDPATTDVRDPFVFTLDGHRFAVQGAGHRQGHASLPVHAVDDLDDWRACGSLLDGDDPVAARIAPANIWECPNLVRLDGRWVLIVSLWEHNDGRDPFAGVRWMLGDLELVDQAPRFSPETGGLIDSGPCFYAPQLLAVDDRVLAWGWAWEHGRAQHQIDEAGWAGCLTFPRELFLAGGLVASRPARELLRLRRWPLEIRAGDPISASAFEIALEPGTQVRLSLVDPTQPRDVSPPATDIEVGTWDVATQPLSRPCLLVDGSMVEVFDGGPTGFTTRAYPTATSRWVVHVESTSGHATRSSGQLDAWRLAPPGG